MNSQKHSTETVETKGKLLDALSACFTNPPTAGAIVAIHGEAGLTHYMINLTQDEALDTYLLVLGHIAPQAGTHSAPELLQ